MAALVQQKNVSGNMSVPLPLSPYSRRYVRLYGNLPDFPEITDFWESVENGNGWRRNPLRQTGEE